MAYFVKLDSLPRHKILFQQSLTVMEDLYQKGITFIPKIIKTKQNQLCSSFATAVVGMFEWLEGENRETDGTKPMEYQMLCQVYPLTRPGWSIPTVSFSDAAAQTFYRYWDTFKHMPQTAAVREVLNLLQERSEVLARCARRLNQVAAWCRAHPGKLYLTHGDAGGNFLVKGHGSTERYYIVDWDEVMYAPLERDAWVMGCAPGQGSCLTIRCKKTIFRIRCTTSDWHFTATICVSFISVNFWRICYRDAMSCSAWQNIVTTAGSGSAFSLRINNRIKKEYVQFRCNGCARKWTYSFYKIGSDG